jgi:hypothetical protein
MLLVPGVVALLFILNVVATAVLWMVRDAERQK